MKKSLKRILAIICCIAVVFTGISVDNLLGKGVQAADQTATSTISLNIESLNNIYGWSTGGFVNLPYTGVASDYANNGFNFLDAAFAEKYITFGGGMTYEDLTEGLNSFYVATNSILQMNWSYRTKAFTEGWSFTIAAGALVPYRTNNGTSYMALDREYTFTFADGASYGYTNVIKMSACKVTSFALTVDTLFGNGISANSEFHFANAATNDIKNYNTKYTAIYNDSQYADYIQISGYDFSELEGASMKIRYILDNGTECIQFENWGDVRNTLQVGEQVIFKEGLPIYYTGTDGLNYKALLDGTYVYECVGSNDQNTHLFIGTKLDTTKNVYGLYTNPTGWETNPQSASNPEQFINVTFDSASSSTITDTTGNFDFLGETVAEDYIQVADYTVQEARALGMAFRFIPSANVLQLGFSETAVDSLEVGDKIILKAGMPIIYKVSDSRMSSATLDDSYVFTVAENNGTNMRLTCALTGTYGLTGNANKGSDDGFSSTGYFNMFFNGDIPTDESFQEVIRDANGTPASDSLLQQEYFTISGRSYDDLKSVITLKAFNISALRGFRFVYNVSGITFEDGDVVMWKEGFPISYSVTAGGMTKQKTIYLDKDYGFVYNGASGTLVYDSSLVSQPETPEEPEETVSVLNIYTEAQYTSPEGRTNLYYTADVAVVADAEVANILSNAETAGYIDMCGVDVATLTANNVGIKFIPGASCFQIIWGDDLSWIEKGDLITFTEGMPVYYYSNGEERHAVLAETVVYEITEIDGASIKVEIHVPTVEYAIATNDVGTGVSSNPDANTNINILNPETGANNVLDDATTVYAPLGASVIAEYIDFFGMTVDEISNHGVTIRFIKDGGAQLIQILWGNAMDALETGDELVFKQGLPFAYTTTNGETKKIVLHQDYTFVAKDGNADNAKILGLKPEEDDEVIVPNLTFRTESALTDADGRTNLYYTPDVAITADAEVNNILENDETASYINVCGINKDTLLGNGVRIKFIPNESCFQIIWGDDLSWIEAGDLITFEAGMPIYYTVDGEEAHAVLQQAAVYEITSVNGSVIQIDTYVETAEFALNMAQFGTGTNAGPDCNSILNILNPETGASDLLNDANTTYSPLSAETIANYVEFFGMTADEMDSHGMSLRFIRDGAIQVLQILWGTGASEVPVGSHLILRKGLPFTYVATDGSTKKIVLNKDYIFEATAGNADHIRLFNYVTTTTVIEKEWALENGTIYNAAYGDGAESYYNNISMAASELTDDISALRYTLDAVTLAEYVNFAGIDSSRYADLGIQVTIIIDGDIKVVQMRWGDTTPLVEAGDEIVFKKGMPIIISENGAKTVYELDADYVFTLYEHTDSANGFQMITTKMDDFNIVITVDGEEVVNGLYRTGTEIDLEQYRNEAVGKVMSIQVNGVATQETTFVVSEEAEVVIVNRSDICIVVFMDEGKEVAAREYLLTDEDIKIPYTPDKDGYDDSWEDFEITNGVIYVNAIHTLRPDNHPVIKLSGVVIEEETDTTENNVATSPGTGDYVNIATWMLISTVAMAFVVLKLTEKNKARNER